MVVVGSQPTACRACRAPGSSRRHVGGNGEYGARAVCHLILFNRFLATLLPNSDTRRMSVQMASASEHDPRALGRLHV